MNILRTILFSCFIVGLVFIPITLIARLIGCIFSSRIRNQVAARPVIHSIWFTLGILIIIHPIIFINYIPPHSIQSQIQTMASAISAATQAYHGEYGRFPLQIDGIDHAYNEEYTSFFNILYGNPEANNENPNRVTYLAPGSRYLDEQGCMIDAWDNPFNIMADWDMDGHVTVGDVIINKPVVVWSNGKNGKNDFGSKDDITTW